mgnify:CR=1 FL=1
MAEFTLTITFDPNTKDCRVTGPVKDYELCRLGLVLAGEVLKQYRKRLLILPSGAPLVVKSPAG